MAIGHLSQFSKQRKKSQLTVVVFNAGVPM